MKDRKTKPIWRNSCEITKLRRTGLRTERRERYVCWEEDQSTAHETFEELKKGEDETIRKKMGGKNDKNLIM